MSLTLLLFSSLTLLIQLNHVNSQCFKVSCGTKDSSNYTQCLSQEQGNLNTGYLTFTSGICDTTNRQYCHQIQDTKKNQVTSVCKSNTSVFEYFPRLQQYPGESCDGVRAIYDCASGYKKCKAHRCLGYPTGSKCLSSFDCNPNFYCDSVTQVCKAVTMEGGKCYSSQECEKSQLCKFDSQTAQNGICTKMFSMIRGSYLYAWNSDDLFLCKDGYALKVEASGMIDPFIFEPALYQCGSTNSLKSLKSGLPCKLHTDCPSNQANIYAKCSCSYSSTDMICGILHENTEYKDYISAANEFADSTRHCHNARDLDSGPCDQQQLYKNYMCKKMKSKYYIENYGAGSCLETYSNKFMFPEIDETQQWCNSDDRFNTLLGLSNARNLINNLTGILVGLVLIVVNM
eukprot:403361683